MRNVFTHLKASFYFCSNTAHSIIHHSSSVLTTAVRQKRDVFYIPALRKWGGRVRSTLDIRLQCPLRSFLLCQFVKFGDWDESTKQRKWCAIARLNSVISGCNSFFVNHVLLYDFRKQIRYCFPNRAQMIYLLTFRHHNSACQYLFSYVCEPLEFSAAYVQNQILCQKLMQKPVILKLLVYFWVLSERVSKRKGSFIRKDLRDSCPG